MCVCVCLHRHIHIKKLWEIIIFDNILGERYDFILHANKSVGSYWIQVRGMGACALQNTQQLAILRYKDAPSKPLIPSPSYDKGLPQGIVSIIYKNYQTITKDAISFVISYKMRNNRKLFYMKKVVIYELIHISRYFCCKISKIL